MTVKERRTIESMSGHAIDLGQGLTIYPGNALEVLRTMSDHSVNCIVTSPPYW